MSEHTGAAAPSEREILAEMTEHYEDAVRQHGDAEYPATVEMMPDELRVVAKALRAALSGAAAQQAEPSEQPQPGEPRIRWVNRFDELYWASLRAFATQAKLEGSPGFIAARDAAKAAREAFETHALGAQPREQERALRATLVETQPGRCERPTFEDGMEQMCGECVPCLDYIADYWYNVAIEMPGEQERLREAQREYRSAADWLCVCARTSGGTAGPDRALMLACERYEAARKALAALDAAPPQQRTPEPRE